MSTPLAILIGFLAGLGISFIFLLVLVILGAKALRSGKHIFNPQESGPEIT